jgi:cell division protein FtsB
MKKNKRIILGSAIAFVVLIVLQVFSTGHGHVVVVEKNEVLTNENSSLTKQNSGLKKNVNYLKTSNKKLVEDKKGLEQMVTEVMSNLDSTKTLVQDIKKELANEKDINLKQSTGEQFDFQPIKLPASDGN